MHEQSPRVRAYLQTLAAVGKQFGLCLGHEDEHGAFKVHEAGTDGGDGWLLDACDMTAEGQTRRHFMYAGNMLRSVRQMERIGREDEHVQACRERAVNDLLIALLGGAS